MAVRATRWVRAVGQPALGWLWLGALLVGCGGQTPAPEKSGQGPAKTLPAAAAQPAKSTFQDAVLPEPPPGEFLPKEGVTKTGKSVGKLYEQITAPGGLWDQVALTTPDGKPLAYTATIRTKLGDIQVE